MNKYTYKKTQDNGDATSNYHLSGQFPVIFKDFVTAILAQEDSFRVEFTEAKSFTETRLECYKKDSDNKWYITKQEPEGWFKDNANRKVTKCWANGGWGQMSYYCTFEEEALQPTQQKDNPNLVAVTIADCQYCPSATLKYDSSSEEDIMYCKTETGIIMLREGWGSRSIPNWCPRLAKERKKKND